LSPSPHEAGHLDRPELRQHQRPVATDGELVTTGLLAEQLDRDAVAGADAVVAGNWNVRGRSECSRHFVEQVVAERLERLRAHCLHGQQRDREMQPGEPRIRIQQLRGLHVGQAREVDGRHQRQSNASLAVRFIRVAHANAIAPVRQQLQRLRIGLLDLVRGQRGQWLRGAGFGPGHLYRSDRRHGSQTAFVLVPQFHVDHDRGSGSDPRGTQLFRCLLAPANSRLRCRQLLVASCSAAAVVAAERFEQGLLLVWRQITKRFELGGRGCLRGLRNGTQRQHPAQGGQQQGNVPEHRRTSDPHNPHGPEIPPLWSMFYSAANSRDEHPAAQQDFP
jgi:hypothetical protein